MVQTNREKQMIKNLTQGSQRKQRRTIYLDKIPAKTMRGRQRGYDKAITYLSYSEVDSGP